MKIIPLSKRIMIGFLTGMFCIMTLTACAEKQDNMKNTTGSETVSDASEPASEPVINNQNIKLAFSLEDIAGKTYTNEMFQDYKLTMVNVFTTWCTPCINEIPDLEKLNQEMAEQGVAVAGIVLDAVDEEGNIDEEAVQKAELLAERTGATYPFLIPDADGLNGRLKGIDAVPETFFVDQEGNIVGETFAGSRSFDDWKTIVEAQLNSLTGEQS